MAVNPGFVLWVARCTAKDGVPQINIRELAWVIGLIQGCIVTEDEVKTALLSLRAR